MLYLTPTRKTDKLYSRISNAKNRDVTIIRKPKGKKTNNILRNKQHIRTKYKAKKIRLPEKRLRAGRLRLRLKFKAIINALKKRFTLRIQIKEI